MEGRFPNGVRLVLTNCTDPSREGEFNRWYDEVHLPDILSAGVATQGLRYQNAESQSGKATYLAIYEIEREDLSNVDREFESVAQHLTQQGRMHPALEIVRRATWRRTGSEFSTGRTEGQVRGIWLTQTTNTDPTQEDAFNRWYDMTHIPDMLDTGLFVTGYRFAALESQPGGSYLAIQETAIDPIEAVQVFRRVHVPRLREHGRLPAPIEIEVTWRGIFRPLTSVVGRQVDRRSTF